MLSSAFGVPAFAQDAAAEAAPASAVCLANTVKGGEKAGRSFVIAVPSDKADKFLARGFTQASCAEAQPLDSAGKRGICEIAAAQDPAVNMYFWERFSFTPEESCKTISAAKQP